MVIEKQLIKYIIEYDEMWSYWEDRLTNVNLLSSTLLSRVDFKKGVFFTLLPSDANLDQIYKFSEGGILPQNPRLSYGDGRKGSYSITPTLENELVLYLLQFININEICIFDNVSGSFLNQKDTDFFQSFGLFHEDEVYYLMTKNNVTPETLSLCIHLSEAFWHSLCVVAPYATCPSRKELTDEDTKKICSEIKIVIVGAYDGEGYVFWQKNK